MPDFSNPFSGNLPGRKLTKEELIRAIRLNIAAEHEAIFVYMAHADATDHPLAKEVLTDVANEEREHLGEFEYLLQVLTGRFIQQPFHHLPPIPLAASGLGRHQRAQQTGPLRA